MSTDELQELAEALEARERLKRDQPILFYQPHQGQLPAHESSARIRIIEGGNRGGKTTFGVAEGISASQGKRPWNDEPFISGNKKQIPVPNVGIVVGESYKTAIQETIWPCFKKWLPDSWIQRRAKNQQGVVDRVELVNGSIIRFMAYNQDPREFEGTSFHWCWYDEPPPKHVFEATQRGLVDYYGRCWFTMTPLSEPWVYQDLVSEAGIDENIFHTRFSSYTNPYVPRKALDEYFAKIKDPAIRKARREGSPLHLQGLVFPEWRNSPPFFVPYFQPDPTWPRVMGIDPHPRKPIALLWVAISPVSGIWYCYREHYSNYWEEHGRELRTVDDVCDLIEEVESFEDITLRVIDPSSQENEKTSGFSVYQQFSERLCMGSGTAPLVLGQKHDKLGGLERLHAMLDTRNLYKTPQLVVMHSCPVLKNNMMNYVWLDWAISTSRIEKDARPDVRKKDDDMIDILRYLRQFGERAEDFRPPTPERKKMIHWDQGGMVGYGRRRSLTGY